MPKARSQRRAVRGERFSWEAEHDQALIGYLNGKLKVDGDQFNGVVDQNVGKKASWVTAAAYLNNHPSFSDSKKLEDKHVRDRWVNHLSLLQHHIIPQAQKEWVEQYVKDNPDKKHTGTSIRKFLGEVDGKYYDSLCCQNLLQMLDNYKKRPRRRRSPSVSTEESDEELDYGSAASAASAPSPVILAFEEVIVVPRVGRVEQLPVVPLVGFDVGTWGADALALLVQNPGILSAFNSQLPVGEAVSIGSLQPSLFAQPAGADLFNLGLPVEFGNDLDPTLLDGLTS